MIRHVGVHRADRRTGRRRTRPGCGNSSLTSMPLWPCGCELERRGHDSRAFALAYRAARGGFSPSCLSSAGLGSNVSTCDGPPFMNRKITRFAAGCERGECRPGDGVPFRGVAACPAGRPPASPGQAEHAEAGRRRGGACARRVQVNGPMVMDGLAIRRSIDDTSSRSTANSTWAYCSQQRSLAWLGQRRGVVPRNCSRQLSSSARGAAAENADRYARPSRRLRSGVDGRIGLASPGARPAPRPARP